MTRTIAPCLVATAVLCASPAVGQTPAENIRARVTDGQKVLITDDDGQEFKGSIRSKDAGGLGLLVGGKQVDVPYDRIVRIDRPNDTLANGALIGLGIGATLGLAAAVANAQQECSPRAFVCFETTTREHVTGTLVLSALGTAVGVGIDALIHRNREIYRRGPGGHVTVAPALGHGRRGAVVSLSW